MSDFQQSFNDFMGGGQASPSAPSFDDSFKSFLTTPTYAKSNPFKAPENVAPQVQIKPTDTKVNLQSIGNDFVNTAKNFIGTVKTAENVIGTLKFLLQPAKQAPAQTDISKEKISPQAINQSKETVDKNTPKAPENPLLKSFNDALKYTPGFNILYATVTDIPNKLDALKGFIGEANGANTLAPLDANVNEGKKVYEPKNVHQLAGKIVYDFIRDLTTGQAGGINQAISSGTQLLGPTISSSETLAPKIGAIRDTLDALATKGEGKLSKLLSELKPLNITIQDMQDVTTGKASLEQQIKYKRAIEIADNLGINIRQVPKLYTESPTTKLISFIKDTVDTVTGAIKSSLKPEEQKLLESGTKNIVEKAVQAGEYTPQELMNTVLQNGIEDTSEGKQIIKMVADAQTSGQNIVVNPVKEVAPVEETGVPHPAEQIQTEQIKTMKDVKQSLGNVKQQFEDLRVQAEGQAALAQEQRAGLNTEDIAKIKRIYNLSPKLQAGDIETFRASKSGDLLNKVIENIQEKNPSMSEQEAFDYALNLPTKASEIARNTPEMRDLIKQQKQLTKYLNSITQKQQELLGTTEIKQGDALYKEWKDAVTAQENLAKILEVPRENLPVGEGDTTPSKLEARMKGALDNTSQENINNLGLSTYEKMNNSDQISKAVDYVSKNPEDALKVLQGEIESPKGILKNSIYVAMDQLASKDAGLALKLASLQSTRFGQEIQILSQLNPTSPVKFLKDVVDIREKAFEAKSKTTAKKAIKDEVEKIKKQIKAPTKQDWSSFLDSIECK